MKGKPDLPLKERLTQARSGQPKGKVLGEMEVNEALGGTEVVNDEAE